MSSAPSATDLAPRTQPKQRRAQATVEKILDTAAQLLEEVGTDGLTTKRIAERAGIRVRSVYRYFPNRSAVTCALAERVAERQKKLLQETTRQSVPGTPWRVALRRELDALIFSFRSEPGLAQIRSAMQASPALRQVHERSQEEIATLWAEDLRSYGLKGKPAQRLFVARTAVQIVAALVDPMERNPNTNTAGAVKELRLVLESYLANYLDNPDI